MRDAIVVGAGVAGLAAAVRLAEAGKTVTVLTKGLGGLQLSQGTLDIFGYNPDRVANPLDAVAAAPQGHPYHLLGADNVRAAVDWLVGVVGPELLVGSADANINLPTAVGAVRPTAFAQPSMTAGVCVDGAKFAIVGLRRLKDFYPKLVAENLSRTTLPDGGRLTARPVLIDVAARDGEIDSTGLTYARALDAPALRKRLAAAIAAQLEDGESVGLPAVLGLSDPNAWSDIAAQLGRPVFEIPLPPPSVPGMRLNTALTARAKALGVRFIMGNTVLNPTVTDGRLTSLEVNASGRPTPYEGSAFVFAPGGFESGALGVDSHGKVSDTILGLPLVGADGDDLICGDYWGTNQRLFSVGLGTNERGVVVNADGAPVYENLYAAGGVLAGAVRWREKSGEGIAIASAVRAADAIIGEA